MMKIEWTQKYGVTMARVGKWFRVAIDNTGILIQADRRIELKPEKTVSEAQRKALLYIRSEAFKLVQELDAQLAASEEGEQS